MSIEAVFLDLDQTLVDRAQTFQTYLAQQFDDLRLSAEGITPERFYTAVHQWDDNGYRDKLDTFSRVASQLSLAVPPETLMAHFRDHYGRDAVLFDGVYDWLKSASRHWPLVLLSNGRQLGQTVKLDVTGIRAFFQHIVISEGVGCKKPQPEIYRHACRLMDTLPSQVLFIGDHPVNDVAAPRSLGMQTVWVRNHVYDPPVSCDATVNSVTELDPTTMTVPDRQ